jgi:hypothetical protein
MARSGRRFLCLQPPRHRSRHLRTFHSRFANAAVMAMPRYGNFCPLPTGEHYFGRGPKVRQKIEYLRLDHAQLAAPTKLAPLDI